MLEAEERTAARRLGRTGFFLDGALKVYINPCGIPDGAGDGSLPFADIVLITDNHPERCSVPDVLRVSRPQTVVVGPADCVCRFRLNQLPLAPGERKSVLGLMIEGTPPPDGAGGIGFLLDWEGRRLRHPGGLPEVGVLAEA